jgi:uncharacterized protein YpiB (UPF0302 family)
MTRRQKISSLLLTYLKGISVTNGYLTNLGSKVYHWRTQITPNENDLIANLQDASNQHERGHTETLTLTVQLSCRNSTNYVTITNMIQDVHKAFTDNEDNLGAALDEQVRFIPLSEEIEITLENNDEYAEALVEMILEHQFTEKWDLDKTIYT